MGKRAFQRAACIASVFVIHYTYLKWFANFDFQQHAMVTTVAVSTKQSFCPRVLVLGLEEPVPTSFEQREYELPAIIREFGIEGHYRASPKRCEIVHQWQRDMHPNCALVHELDFFGGITAFDNAKLQTKYLGLGGTRESWKVVSLNGGTEQHVAMKTLRFDKDYIWTRVDHQRVDATVSEHLTSSPHVIDIYGYCGTAAINEFGSEGMLHRYIRDGKVSFEKRLEFARDIAYGMAAVHASHMVQHDVKASNVLITNGKAKISDFNNVHFERADKDNKMCHFSFQSACIKEINGQIEVSFCFVHYFRF